MPGFPPAAHSTSALPVVSLSGYATSQALGEALSEVCRGEGFFYLKNHGISQDLVESAFRIANDFFIKAPAEQKTPGNGDMGYTAVRQECLDSLMPGNGDLKESFYLADPSWQKAINQEQYLPSMLDAQRDNLAEFMSACTSCSQRLLKGLACALDLEEHYLAKQHNGEHSRLRLLHYPPAEMGDDSATDVRAGAHTDYGSITLLFQHRVSGLQVQRAGEWLDVPPMEGCIVINIGDALEFWTGGQYRSTVHRVVMPRTTEETVSRFSIAYFVQPDDDTPLDPLVSEAALEDVDFDALIARKGLQAGTRSLTGGEYLRTRIAATYGPKKPLKT